MLQWDTFFQIALYLNMPKLNCPVSDSRRLNQHWLSHVELNFLPASLSLTLYWTCVCRGPFTPPPPTILKLLIYASTWPYYDLCHMGYIEQNHVVHNILPSSLWEGINSDIFSCGDFSEASCPLWYLSMMAFSFMFTLSYPCYIWPFLLCLL